MMLSVLLLSCGKKISDTPKGCVTAFIVAVEQHDMSKAWGLLGKDAQAYYNDLGEKQRRSGKGALENEIDQIKSFRSAQKFFSVKRDNDDPNNALLVVQGVKEYKIATEDADGEIKIKDAQSVKNIFDVITGEMKSTNPY
jgi:hypothetical protein